MKSVFLTLRKFFRADAKQRKYLLQTATLLPFVAFSLTLFRYRRTHLMLNKLVKVTRWEHLNEADKDLLIQYLSQANRRVKRRGPFRGNCLSRSLLLWTQLQRQGIPAQIFVGQSKEQGLFKAHAWVEHQGVPLNAGRLVRQRYTAFKKAFSPQLLKQDSA